MNPKKKTFWACGSCGSAHVSEAFADQCCRCHRCGGPGLYTGTNNICKTCRDRHELETARQNLKHAQDALDAAKKRLEP